MRLFILCAMFTLFSFSASAQTYEQGYHVGESFVDDYCVQGYTWTWAWNNNGGNTTFNWAMLRGWTDYAMGYQQAFFDHYCHPTYTVNLAGGDPFVIGSDVGTQCASPPCL